MMLFSTGCAADWQGRLARAERDKARAELVGEALKPVPLPDWPADCRKREASGVAKGDRLDVALLKSERALGRANARIDRCAGFYNDLRTGRETAE